MQAPAPHQAHPSPRQKLAWLLPAALCITVCISTTAISFAQKRPLRQVAAGKRWFVKYGCDVCHTTDGSDSFGGTLKGIYGTHATLEDRKIILRDDAYFRAKIAYSAKMPLANGTNTMPIYKDSLSTQQMTAIIALIKSLHATKPTSKPPTLSGRKAQSASTKPKGLVATQSLSPSRSPSPQSPSQRKGDFFGHQPTNKPTSKPANEPTSKPTSN